MRICSPSTKSRTKSSRIKEPPYRTSIRHAAIPTFFEATRSLAHRLAGSPLCSDRSLLVGYRLCLPTAYDQGLKGSLGTTLTLQMLQVLSGGYNGAKSRANQAV